MPLCSARSTASRATSSASTSFSSSSGARSSRASGTLTLRRLLLSAEEAREHVLEVEAHLLHARGGEDLHGRCRPGADLHLHRPLVELPAPEPLAHLLAARRPSGSGRRRGRPGRFAGSSGAGSPGR